MQPIFKEMIQMWNDLGYPLPIEEGKYWLENHFVCGFTADGELHKLYKYKVADDLSIEITPYKPNKIKLLFLFVIFFHAAILCSVLIIRTVKTVPTTTISFIGLICKFAVFAYTTITIHNCSPVYFYQLLYALLYSFSILCMTTDSRISMWRS